MADITKSDAYNEDFVKNLLAEIASEREEAEKKLQHEEAEKRAYDFKK